MASVKEVLTASMGYKFPNATIEMALTENGLNPNDERDANDGDQNKAMDMSRASLIDFLITLPKSVRELDYQITQQDVDALLSMRKRLLSKWGASEPSGESSFVDLTNTH